jgi:ribose transport system permease protein
VSVEQSSPESRTPPRTIGRPSLGDARERYGRFGMVPVLIVIAVWAAVENPHLTHWSTFSTVIGENAGVGIVAVGLTFVLIAGGIDISLGAIYAGGSSVYAKMAVHHSLPEAFVVAILVGMAAGAVNALLITRCRFNAFVVTLATGTAFGGLVLLYSGLNATYPTNPSFATLGNNSVAGIPYLVIFVAGMLVVGALVLHRTSYGKALYAVGGNLEASRLAGLRTDWLRGSTYVISGGCAAFAGLLAASQSGSGVGNIGANLVITALVIVVIGGTSLSGGEGAIWRTAIGLLILSLLGNLFDVLVVSNATQQLVEGGILVGALALDQAVRIRS